MCILFIAIGQHPEHPLVIAANRDEYYRRPSLDMHWWEDRPDILAGRDLVAGGTWLGLHRNGAFAAVTNFRLGGEPRPDARSRGELVARYLESDGDTDRFIAFLRRDHRLYNPFNLVFGDVSGLYTWGHLDARANRLGEGFHSVSNGPMDDHWPKMSLGVAGLTRRVHRDATLSAEALLPIMLDDRPAADGDLPDTGHDLARERQLSPIFIRGQDYGTRTTTLLLFDRNAVDITEYQHDPQSSRIGSCRFRVSIPKNVSETGDPAPSGGISQGA